MTRIVAIILLLIIPSWAYAQTLTCDNYPITSTHPDYFKITVNNGDPIYLMAAYADGNKSLSYDMSELSGVNKIKVYACTTANAITNGNFTDNTYWGTYADEVWTWPTGWTQSSYYATHDADGTDALTEGSLTPVASTEYEVSYYITSFYTGTMTPSIGNTNLAAKTFVNGLNSYTTMSVGTTATQIKTTQFWYAIGGTAYSKDAVDGTAPGDDVIPETKYGCVALDIGADGTFDVVEATANSTGYDTAELTMAGLPAVAENHLRVGTLTVTKSDGAFTFGTTELSAENVTYSWTGTGINPSVYVVERVTTANTDPLKFTPSETSRFSIGTVKVMKVGDHAADDTCSDYSFFGLNTKYTTTTGGSDKTMTVTGGSNTATWTGNEHD